MLGKAAAHQHGDAAGRTGAGTAAAGKLAAQAGARFQVRKKEKGGEKKKAGRVVRLVLEATSETRISAHLKIITRLVSSSLSCKANKKGCMKVIKAHSAGRLATGFLADSIHLDCWCHRRLLFSSCFCARPSSPAAENRHWQCTLSGSKQPFCYFTKHTNY